MNRPNKVEALPGFRIHVGYPDGVEGVIDLSADVGRGVFAPLADEKFFLTVHIGSFGQIAWTEEIEICPDAVHQKINGKAATTAHRPIQQARGFLRGMDTTIERDDFDRFLAAVPHRKPEETDRLPE